MAKYTTEQIESKLDKVFDSVMQTKEVEVSEDTTIKADEGFLGLKEVSVKVSVGGDTPSGGGNYEYLDVSGMEQMFRNLVATKFAFISRIETEGQPIIFVANTNSELTPDTTKVMIDTDAVVTLNLTTGETASVGESLALIEAQLGATIPRITESEFYNIG